MDEIRINIIDREVVRDGYKENSVWEFKNGEVFVREGKWFEVDVFIVSVLYEWRFIIYVIIVIVLILLMGFVYMLVFFFFRWFWRMCWFFCYSFVVIGGLLEYVKWGIFESFGFVDINYKYKSFCWFFD